MAGEWYRTLQDSFGAQRPRPPAFSSGIKPPTFGSSSTAPSANQGFQPRGAPEALQLEQFVPEGATGEIGGIAGAIDTGFRAPTTILERPLAFVDIAAQNAGIIDQGGSILDPVVEGIRGLPVVGEHLSNAGDLTMEALDFTFSEGNLISQPVNTAVASLWASVQDHEEDEGIGFIDELQSVLPFIGAGQDVFQLLNPNDSITKAELREGLNNLGWTPKDLQDIETGRKGWMDFHDKPIRSGLVAPGELEGIENFIWRAVGDPLNLLMGAGAISKVGLLFKGGKAAKAGTLSKSGKAVQGTKVTRSPNVRVNPAALSETMRAVKINHIALKRAPFIARKALPLNEGVAAIGAGKSAGVTQASAAKYILSKAAVGGKLAGKTYLRTAYASTGVQLGLNSLDQVINGDAEAPDGFMGDVFNFARRWGDHKPLSRNDLFSLYMIMKVPGRTIVENSLRPAKNKLNTGTFADTFVSPDTGLRHALKDTFINEQGARVAKPGAKVVKPGGRSMHHENVVYEMLFPDEVTRNLKKGKGGAKDYSKAKAKFVETIGGERQAAAAMSHIVRAALHKKNVLEGVPSLPRFFHVTSMAESGGIIDNYSRLMERFVREALEGGTLKSRDIKAAVEDFSATRGGILEDVTRGVHGQFRPEDFFATWKAWEPLANSVATAFKNGVAIRQGITADLVTTDGISWLLTHIDAAKAGKNISGDDLMTILRSEPAVFNFPGGEKFARVLTQDGIKESYPVADIKDWLNTVSKDHAISRMEYVASFEAWEGLSKGTQGLIDFHNAKLAAGGKLADDVVELPNSTVSNIPAANADALAASQAELGGSGVGVLQHLRNSTIGQAFRYNVPAGLKLAGYGVVSATDNIMLLAGRSGRHGMAVPGLSVRLTTGRPFQDALDAVAMGIERSEAGVGTAILRGNLEITAQGMKANADELTYQVGNLTPDEWNNLINKLNDEWGHRVTLNDTTGTVRILVPDGQSRGRTERLAKADKLLGGKKTTDRVAFRDVVKRKSDAPPGSVQGRDYVLLKDHLKVARKHKRYHIANEYIDEGVGGYSGAGVRAGRTSAAEQARSEAGGQYTDGADGSPVSSQPTRWEARNGGGVRSRSEEHLVRGTNGPRVSERWNEKIRAAGALDTPHGERFSLRRGDRVYATGKPGAANYGRGGVVVRSDGEIIPWISDGPGPKPDDWGDVLAESTREGTWARFIDSETRGGDTIIDLLGEHGYVPIVRGRASTGNVGDDLDDVVYMLFDPDNFHGKSLGSTRWKDARGSHSSMRLKDPRQAKAQTLGYVESVHPERVKRLVEAGQDAELSKAAIARKAEIDAETINPGRVTFVQGAEKDVSKFKVYLDESIEGNLDTLPPGEIEKLYNLEAEMRLTGTYVDNTGQLIDAANYRLKRLPREATPYRGTQIESEAYNAITAGRLAAEDGWRTYMTSKFAQGQEMLFGRVYAVEQQTQMRQEMYNELLAKGAAPAQVNAFLKAVQQFWENQSFPAKFLGARAMRSVDMLPPGTIDKIARGELKGLEFKGFSSEVLEQVDNFGDVIQRASSRTFRNLAKKYPAQDGRGHLGKLIEVAYGKQAGRGGGLAKAGRRVTYGGTVGYTVLRFMLDPRWYLMNMFEADILGMARWGSKVRGVGRGKARGVGLLDHMRGKDPAVPRDPFVEIMSPRRKDASLLSVDEILHANAGASGWMDPRNLYGYVAEAAKIERPMITSKLFQQMIDDGSPVIDDLIARHGKNQQAWFDEVDDLLYSIDTIGAKRTVLDNELAVIMKNDPVRGQLYEEFLTNLWKQQRQMFKDVTHTFHGNINRSNMERLVNSPFLWWPMSYQLKTGKWLIDVMTKSFAGSKAELAGTGALAKLLANHRWAMENDDEYFKTFDEHPALWRALGMMLPITPFDMGVFMARWTRYAGSWTGAQLGLWEQDPSYPQNLQNFFTRSLALGPVYSSDVIGDITDELRRQDDSKLDFD